jgi:hypothetical protein
MKYKHKFKNLIDSETKKSITFIENISILELAKRKLGISKQLKNFNQKILDGKSILPKN